jgi:predicted anti-sigma-YlaC factor YlaD
MKCKQLHNNLIGLIEQTLPEALSTEMLNHIDSCKACKTCYDNVKATYHVFDRSVPEINPYFYTKLMNRIESKAKIEAPSISFARRLQPVAIILLLAIGTGLGVLIGKNLANYKTDSDRKTMLDTYASEYYLNDTNEESLNVLLTNE